MLSGEGWVRINRQSLTLLSYLLNHDILFSLWIGRFCPDANPKNPGNFCETGILSAPEKLKTYLALLALCRSAVRIIPPQQQPFCCNIQFSHKH